MSALCYWIISGAVLVVFAVVLGRGAKYRNEDGVEKEHAWFGILIDERQRFSLTHLQIVLWSLVLISLIAGIFLARLFNGTAADALSFTIPPEILILAGISGGSAVIATAIKAPRTENIRNLRVKKIVRGTRNKTGIAKLILLPSRFSQMFMVEEGEAADKVIDPTKFQNFCLTLIAVTAYIITAGTELANTRVPLGIPEFSKHLLWVIGVSHGAYVAGKFPERK